MTKYQSLMEKSEAEERLAIKFAQFHKNASNGFKEKARNLTIEEVEKEI